MYVHTYILMNNKVFIKNALYPKCMYVCMFVLFMHLSLVCCYKSLKNSNWHKFESSLVLFSIYRILNLKDLNFLLSTFIFSTCMQYNTKLLFLCNFLIKISGVLKYLVTYLAYKIYTYIHWHVCMYLHMYVCTLKN